MIMVDSESSEDYNSDEDVGRCKFMPVQLPPNFDPNKVPTSGEEYLHYVMYEAKKFKNMPSGDISGRKINESTGTFSPLEECAAAPKSMIPNGQWQTEKIEEFVQFRKYVESRLPNLSDIDKCDHAFWAKKMDKEYPKFSVVSSFNSHAHLILLEKISSKLDLIKHGDTVSDTVGCWIYCILSLLQIPLNPDICSALRHLARQCAKIRSRLSSDASITMYRHLNLFICIISRYFAQYDLGDNDM